MLNCSVAMNGTNHIAESNIPIFTRFFVIEICNHFIENHRRVHMNIIEKKIYAKYQFKTKQSALPNRWCRVPCAVCKACKFDEKPSSSSQQFHISLWTQWNCQTLHIMDFRHRLDAYVVPTTMNAYNFNNQKLTYWKLQAYQLDNREWNALQRSHYYGCVYEWKTYRIYAISESFTGNIINICLIRFRAACMLPIEII